MSKRPLEVVRKHPVTVVVVLAVVASVAYVGWQQGRPIEIDRADVVEFRLEPFPEGPQLTISPAIGDERWARALAAIPEPLPHPSLLQALCTRGGELVIAFRTGEELRYGPCRRPASIEQL